MKITRSWDVVVNEVEHHIQIVLNLLTGGVAVSVDGARAATRSGWRMGPGGADVPFEVGGRPALAVIRPNHGAPERSEVIAYVDQRSLDTGELLRVREIGEARQVPGLLSLLIVALAGTGLAATLANITRGGRVDWPVAAISVGTTIVIAAAAGLLVRAWYRAQPPGAPRTVIGVATVLIAYVLAIGAIVWSRTTL